MKWSPEKCLPGDMIRIRLGSFCHYGIYVSDEEVIQFGLPPVDGLPKNGDGIRVLSTDIDTFSCGKIVEVGVPERAGGEKRRRFSAKKTVENARARLGEGGYNVLHNNCEHFVWECAFGIHRSTAEDEAQARWRKLLSDKGRESGSAK